MSTLPRMSTISKPRPRAWSWAARRGDPVPTRLPAGSSPRVSPSRATTTSRGSSRSGYGGQHEAGGRAGRQVLERVDGDVDAAVEQRLAQRADEDAGAAELGQRLRRRGRRSVVISTSSTSRPRAAVSRSATQRDWVSGEERGAGAEADRAHASSPRRPVRRPAPPAGSPRRRPRGRGRTARPGPWRTTSALRSPSSLARIVGWWTSLSVTRRRVCSSSARVRRRGRAGGARGAPSRTRRRRWPSSAGRPRSGVRPAWRRADRNASTSSVTIVRTASTSAPASELAGGRRRGRRASPG